ncbi:hypothetical protein U3516DRAFT_921685 [Neocallimastix sp. 'constans']
MKQNCSGSPYGWMVLKCTVLYSDKEILQRVLNAKDSNGNKLIDVNYQDDLGNTALSIAEETGDEEKNDFVA